MLAISYSEISGIKKSLSCNSVVFSLVMRLRFWNLKYLRADRERCVDVSAV